MTNEEKKKCEKLMEYGIRIGKESQEEYALYEEYVKQNEEVKAALEQRKADQHYGEIVGIGQVLASLGFQHEKMKQLYKLI
ncbi:hypothetical protein [Robinsoniella peoriensis]|uniref:hypothetical protein n=1 Tax=Robinsoniella peoriensis TaxID=180332 RepID=UPI0005C7E021|nr:hypothetical protein [Robinsoniella peoriensis]